MKIYTTFSSEGTDYFATKREAVRSARATAQRDRREVEVSEIVVTPTLTGRARVIALLTGCGFAESATLVAIFTPPESR